MHTDLAAPARIPVARWVLLGYVLIVTVATYTLGFPAFLFGVLLGGLVLGIVGFASRRWWLAVAGVVLVGVAAFILIDIGTAYVVTVQR